MQTICPILKIKLNKMLLLASSKLSFNFLALLLSFTISILLTISLSISPSIFLSILSSLILFNKSVPRTLVFFLYFVSTTHLFFTGFTENSFVDAQLIINLKNRGGEVFQEAISANITEDVIEVEYQNTDGNLVTQLIDFRNNLLLFRLILLNEQDILGDSQKYQRFPYQRLCYVTLLNRSEFISTDDIMKLRQRNPSAIRDPEQDKGKEIIHMNFALSLNESKRLSNHIVRLCTAVGQENVQIYTRYEDLKSLAPGLRDDLNDDNYDEDDDEDYRNYDIRNEANFKKTLNEKDFKEKNLKNKKDVDNDLKYIVIDNEKHLNQFTEVTTKKEEIIEKNMKNRCFMQTFQPNFVQDKTVDNKVDSLLVNYERLKLKLKQMMDKSKIKGSTKDLTEKSIEKNRFIQSSLTPKSLNDFSTYWESTNTEDKNFNNLRDHLKTSKKRSDLFKNKKQISKELTKEPSKDLYKNPLNNTNKSSSCYCKIEICIPWYPCTVKYCRTTDKSNDKTIVSSLNPNELNRSQSDRVRCGIKSCKKCWLFYFQKLKTLHYGYSLNDL